MKILVLADKFRGTITSAEFFSVVYDVLHTTHDVKGHVVSDGGEGLLEAIGGKMVYVDVHDALMRPIRAPYALQENGDAIIEMSRASGLTQIGGPSGNDPLAASTFGSGELIRAAIENGARHVIVGCGGSASTDGGIGALEALGQRIETPGLRLTALVDVSTKYVDAAVEFATQKGASPTQVKFLERRLFGASELLVKKFGRSPRDVPGTGAAGGLPGMIYSAGGEIVFGFDYMTELFNLASEVSECDIVITGEGRVDAESFNGKVVGSVISLARQCGKRTLVVCGQYTAEALSGLTSESVKIVSLVERFGEIQSFRETRRCISAILSDEDIFD